MTLLRSPESQWISGGNHCPPRRRSFRPTSREEESTKHIKIYGRCPKTMLLPVNTMLICVRTHPTPLPAGRRLNGLVMLVYCVSFSLNPPGRKSWYLDCVPLPLPLRCFRFAFVDGRWDEPTLSPVSGALMGLTGVGNHGSQHGGKFIRLQP